MMQNGFQAAAEIYADDVKCSHWSDCLPARRECAFLHADEGIGKREARLLLMFAFAHGSFRT